MPLQQNSIIRPIGPGVLSGAVATLFFAACLWPEIKTTRETNWSGAEVAEGKRLYRAVCAGCHGENGDGNSAVAERLFPPPRNLSLGTYRFRTTSSGMIPRRKDLLRTIARGLPGTAMPAWQPQLSWIEMMSIVLYLETLSPRFADEDEKLEPDDILIKQDPRPQPRTAGLIARGKAVYERMKCAECHGASGHGDGPAAGKQKNTDGTPAHVFDFTYGVYKSGRRPADLYRTFITGLDGTPMPSFGDSITDETDRWALVYYCLSLSRKRGVWFYLSQRPTWREPAAD